MDYLWTPWRYRYIADATKDDVKPGAKVFISGTPNPDGTMLTKGFLAVGKDGTTPPM